MADSDISGLTENTAPVASDLLVLVDDPAGSPLTQKITLNNLLKVINQLTTDSSPVGSTDYLVTYDASASLPKKVLIDSLLGLIDTGLTNSIASVTTSNVTGVVGTRHILDVSGMTANRNFVLPTPAVGDEIEVVISAGDDTYNLIFIGDTGISINGGSTATEWKRTRNKSDVVRFIGTSTTNWEVVYDGLKSVFYITKSADETVNNNATVQNDDEFSFSIAANEKWLVEMWLVITSPSANSDFKFDFTVPASCEVRYGVTNNAGALLAWGHVTSANSPSGLATAGATAIAVGGFNGTWGATVEGVFSNSTTTGTIQFRWAQNSATAENTVVKANSVMRFTKL